MKLRLRKKMRRNLICTCFVGYWFTRDQQRQDITTRTSREKTSGTNSTIRQWRKLTWHKLSKQSALEEETQKPATLTCSFTKESKQIFCKMISTIKTAKKCKLSNQSLILKYKLTRRSPLKSKKGITAFSLNKFQKTITSSNWWWMKTEISSRKDFCMIFVSGNSSLISLRWFDRPKRATHTKPNSIKEKSTCYRKNWLKYKGSILSWIPRQKNRLFISKATQWWKLRKWSKWLMKKKRESNKKETGYPEKMTSSAKSSTKP